MVGANKELWNLKRDHRKHLCVDWLAGRLNWQDYYQFAYETKYICYGLGLESIGLFVLRLKCIMKQMKIISKWISK